MRLNRTIKYVSFVFCVVCAIRITLYAYCGLTYGTQYSLSRCVSEGARYHSDPKRLRNGEHLPRGSHGIRGHDEAGTVERETIQGLRDRLKAMAKGSKKSVIDPEDEKGPSCVKRILFWSRESPEVVAKFSSTEEMCRQNSTCNVNFKISMNWYDFRDSHAVIFHHKVYKDWKKLMRRRPPGQIWIFYTRESPNHFSEKNNFPKGVTENVHNWTQVYLSGSDLSTIYGRFIPNDRRNSESNHEIENLWANKTKFCSWIASNCRYTSWDRMGFVKELQQFIPIDIYGKCGDLNCPEDCLDVLPHYKFYLALESNTCQEYITEKVWRNSFTRNVIPVVYGAPKADYERLLPPNSFIHVEDFKSFRELADFLIKLGKDEERYNSYFSWKRDGAIIRQTKSSVFTHSSVCDIAQKLLDLERGVEMKPKYQGKKYQRLVGGFMFHR